MAITVVNTATVAIASTLAQSLAIQVGNAGERYLLVAYAMRTNTGIGRNVVWQPDANVTPGLNQNLTFLGGQNHASQLVRVEFWGLVNPTAAPTPGSTSRVQVGQNGSFRSMVTAICFSGVSQTQPFATASAFDQATSVPSALAFVGQAESPMATGTTTSLVIASAVNELVVDMLAADETLSGQLKLVAGSGQTAYCTRIAVPTGTSAVHEGVSSKPGAASTSLSWNWGTTTGHSYVDGGFPLKPSTSIAPYWIEPAETESRGSQTLPVTSVSVQNVSAFPTAGAVAIGTGQQIRGSATVNPDVYRVAYATVTASPASLDGATGGSVTLAVGDRVTQFPVFGDTTTATGTIGVICPSYVALNDILIVAIKSDDIATAIVSPSTHPGPGVDFTQIQSSVAGTVRMTTFWRRVIAGDAGTTFTFTCGAAVRQAGVLVMRGCIASGSPIDTSTSNTGTAQTATATGLSTAAVDENVVAVYATTGARYFTTPPLMSERFRFYQLYMADMSVLAAGAVAAQDNVIDAAPTSWAAQLIALKPTAGSTFIRSISRAGTQAGTDSRAGSTYRRTDARAGTLAAAVSRASSTMHRTLARVGTLVATVSRSAARTRTAAFVKAGTQTVSRAGSTWHRTITRNGLIAAVVHRANAVHRTLARTTGTLVATVSRAPWTTHRSIARVGSLVAAVKRAGSTMHRSASRSTTTFSMTPSRRGSTFRRTITRGTTTVVVTVSRTVTGAAVSFFAFGPEPVLRRYDATDWVNVSFYFEATLKSSDNTQTAYARLYDVTAAGGVAGSQITTSSPHATGQRVRSSAIVLISGHTYRAEQGHGTGYTAVMSAADIVVEMNA